jgi:hypothetical protein
MSTGIHDGIEASDETVPGKSLKILRQGVFTRADDPDLFSSQDDESVGFDPYDTASLYVEKTSGQT